jgi:hypothetical protein
VSSVVKVLDPENSNDRSCGYILPTAPSTRSAHIVRFFVDFFRENRISHNKTRAFIPGPNRSAIPLELCNRIPLLAIVGSYLISAVS